MAVTHACHSSHEFSPVTANCHCDTTMSLYLRVLACFPTVILIQSLISFLLANANFNSRYLYLCTSVVASPHVCLTPPSERHLPPCPPPLPIGGQIGGQVVVVGFGALITWVLRFHYVTPRPPTSPRVGIVPNRLPTTCASRGHRAHSPNLNSASRPTMLVPDWPPPRGPQRRGMRSSA